MTEALELLLVELAVETALDPDDNQDVTSTLEAVASTALADLSSVDDSLIDEAAPAASLLDKCTAARSKLLDIGLGLEASMAELTRRPSALGGTRRLVRRQRREADDARRLLEEQLRLLSDAPGDAVEAARQINVCIAHALTDAPPGAFDRDEIEALRGLCERVLALIWFPSSDEEESARRVVADTCALAGLLGHDASRWFAAA